MTTVERYDEQGEPIYAIEGGPLKHLWKNLAIINEVDLKKKETPTEINFDYNEFFKRLYLSRAELDVTNSILQLLLGETDGGDINISCVHHENEITRRDNEKSSTISSAQHIYLLKNSLLAEVSKDLKLNAESLAKDRKEEHEIISEILLKLRENYRWNLVRISNSEQIQVLLDYKEMSPIIGIDFSPLSLFKDQSSREQHNYKHHYQIGSESLAIVVRHKSGNLALLFQQKLNYRKLAASVCLKNLKTGKESRTILFKPASQDLLKYSIDNLSGWNSQLLDARDRTTCLNIMKLLANEASVIPNDHVDFDPKNLRISLNDEILFTINFTESSVVEEIDAVSAFDTYNVLLKEYISSSGSNANWCSLRLKILNLISI